MKKVVIHIASIVAILITVPAFAGPDWQLIEKGRQANQVEKQHQAQMEQMMKACSEMMKKHS